MNIASYNMGCYIDQSDTVPFNVCFNLAVRLKDNKYMVYPTYAIEYNLSTIHGKLKISYDAIRTIHSLKRKDLKLVKDIEVSLYLNVFFQ
jgi:hypothetical protein